MHAYKPDLLRGSDDIFLLKSEICPSSRPVIPRKILDKSVKKLNFCHLSLWQ